MKARRKFRESKSHAVAWGALVVVAAIAFLCFRGVSSVFAVYNSWIEDLPTINSDSFNFAEDSYMYAADGKTLLAKFQLEKRDPVTIDQISDYVKKATVDTEDIRFYEHNGVDPQGIMRALTRILTGGNLEGASTITQQLVRNTALSEEASDITLERKAREAELALEMEHEYTKEEILNMYLNTINYGDGCYGIEAAAKNYFQVSAADLSLTQAATLAGIPQSPTAFNPKENPEACIERRNLVLERMKFAGDITEEEYKSAINEGLGLDPADEEPSQGIYAYPYFTSFVRDELMKADNIYGCSYADLFQGGLKIYTTLDTNLQKKADAACKEQYSSMDADLDAALVAMDPNTGYVLAIVGGNDFYKDQWNIATQGGRPSGSTFKVFALTAAIEQGINPLAAVDCSSPLKLTNGTEINNFNNETYGQMTIADATAISSNTGYYRLTEKIGVSSLVEMAHRMGIKSDLSQYPIIVLGTENVTPLEMAEAYSTLATGGIHRDAVVISRIEDKNGEVLFENADTSERVLDESVAAATTEVLRGVFESSYGTAYGFGPSNGQPVAGKTGTGQEYRDHWLVGYTPNLTCSVWIGNRDYSSTSEDLSANGLWHNFMSAALEGTDYVDFPIVADPIYNNTQFTLGTSYTPDDEDDEESEEDKEIKEKVNSFEAGELTEDDVEGQYGDYEVSISYEYSEEYPEGTVLSQNLDSSSKTIYMVVSLGSGEEDSEEKEAEDEENYGTETDEENAY
ncbi:MAG: penicillin-binding protein [Eggerthellaceae bacterium]|nr:penicillin-binding protein [Eggerthellaceae bacterium]